MTKPKGDILQDPMPSTKRSRSPDPPAARFDRTPSSRSAVQHSVRHDVVSQVIRPDMAAFMPNSRVVVRTHHDELCCVDEVRVIADTPLGEVDLEYLEQFPHLVSLHFGEKPTDAVQLALVARRLPQLQHLDLGWCRGVDHAGVASVSKLSQLRPLNLTACEGVDAGSLAAIGKLTLLQHLALSSCEFVDAVGLAEVSNLPELRYLDLGGCPGVDAAGLASLQKLARLQHLDLTSCDGVDAAGLASVGKLSA